ncbi:efflux RND transporter periplasmic adaptor subunit [bacterium]|nr:efflux RND transporter periplasmic adaptor subunit [bacterium]
MPFPNAAAASRRASSIAPLLQAARRVESFRGCDPVRFTRLLVLSCLLLILCGCGAGGPAQSDQKKPAAEPAELPTLDAETLVVTEQPWSKVVRTQGSLVADEVSVVGARVAGRVAQSPVDLGDQVRAGDLLVSLDREEFQLDVVQAEAQLSQSRAAVGLKPEDSVAQLNRENSPPVRQEKALWDEARANLTRAQELIARDALTETDREQLVAAERVGEARYASALNSVSEKIALIHVRESELAIAQQRLRDAEIHAPFAGLIEQRHVAPGAYVKVGDPLVTLVRTHPLRFRGTMPERHAAELALNQEVRLHLEPGDEPLTVHVTRISPTLDLLSRSLLFEAEVDNADGHLQTGLFAEAEVVLSEETVAIAVPAASVVEFAGAEKVWRIQDGVARERIVLTGARRGEQIEILDGLAPGDEILRDGSVGKVARVERR